VTNDQRLLTTREVGEMLALSPAAVLRRWRAGELPGFRLSSKALRFRESELLAWLEERREGPTSSRSDLRVVDSVQRGEVEDASASAGMGQEA
jgi:predicted DNA-binding transcriptional regulator AlpA